MDAMHAFANGGGGGVFDALLSSSDEKLLGGGVSHAAAAATRLRLPEPYERHRAHDLRAECYRRGLRPVKKGPHANDNKHGYVQLLRQHDASGGGGGSSSSTNSNSSSNSGGGAGGTMAANEAAAHDDEGDDGAATPDNALPPMRGKQSAGGNSSSGGADGANGAAAAAAVADLSAFYESAPLVPPLAAAYAAKSPQAGSSSNSSGSAAVSGGGVNGSATDLEILSGIANTYTQNAAGDAQLCGSCRTVVTDQLMESIRLGRTKMQLLESHRVAEQRDRDTTHLKQVLGVLLDLRRAHREAQLGGSVDHDLLVELEDDIAFFRALKERTKARMRLAMIANGTRERAANQTADTGSS